MTYPLPPTACPSRPSVFATRFLSFGIVALLCHCPLPVCAQDTRSEAIARQQEEKSRDLRHYEFSKVEKLLSRMSEGERFFSRNPRGLYPYFDSVYSGGGFTLGAGYRKYFADEAHFDVRGLYSVRNWRGSCRWMS